MFDPRRDGLLRGKGEKNVHYYVNGRREEEGGKGPVVEDGGKKEDQRCKRGGKGKGEVIRIRRMD